MMAVFFASFHLNENAMLDSQASKLRLEQQHLFKKTDLAGKWSWKKF